MATLGYAAATMTALTAKAMRSAIEAAGLAGRPVNLHASLRACGWVDGGAEAVVEAFLSLGCTLMVPTHSWGYFVVPPRSRWANNGHIGRFFCEVDMELSRPDLGVYDRASRVIDGPEMGAIPRYVVQDDRRARGQHPLSSYSAIGPDAERLVAEQSPSDAFAPCRRLIQLRGHIALLGVDLSSLTHLHYAEELGGRRSLVRWARSDTGIIEVDVGGCSDGFLRFTEPLSEIRREVAFGQTQLVAYEAAHLTDIVVEGIRADIGATHCGDRACIRCNDGKRGGPKLRSASQRT